MKKLLLLLTLTFFMVGCGGTKTVTRKITPTSGDETIKKTTKVKKKDDKLVRKVDYETEEITKSSNEEILENIIEYARSFEGTRYKFGGTTKAGMDCSGLVYTAFKQQDVLMPRISRDMATKGVEVRLKDAVEGDLVFFKTSRRNTINHVGLVVESKKGEVFFIHSTTSRGVIISSMNEAYWKKAFVEARRVI
jgi:cell wall-associated NlpC family hydrolase